MAEKQKDGEIPQNVIAPTPLQQLGVIQLLEGYERYVGPLEKLKVPKPMPGMKNSWPWSWTPDQVTLLMSSWADATPLIIPKLRDLAFTESPDGKAFMYDKACQRHVVDAIERSQAVLSEPVGSIPPWPTGPCSFDTRPHPPGIPSTGITINYWHILPGVVTGISQSFRDQLAEIHGRWMAAAMRLGQGMDHPLNPEMTLA